MTRCSFAVRVAGLLLVALSGTKSSYGQAAAGGVEVSPDGVLRTGIVVDPRGVLTRERIAAAKAQLDGKVARPSPLRKISLNRLEAALATRLAKGLGPTDDMKFLVGLTRLRYVFFYPDTKDLVIAGPAEGYADVGGRPVGMETGQVVLELQDLIVALRAYSPDGQKAKVVGCSIDPTKEGLVRMQQFLRSIAGRVQPGDAQRIALGLRESLGLNNVTVKGVSAKTHFAQVLVEADYRMKLIGIGLEHPPVNIESYVARANPKDVARNALQRWYFTPNYECVKVAEDDLAMELVGDGVKLISEDELVQGDGQRVNAASTNRASQAFCTTFTAKYPELAKRSPVYGQLRNLIDLAIAAAFIQHKDYYAQAGWRMELFGDEQTVPVETYNAPKTVESAVNIVWKGNTLITPIGGGVNVQPRLALASERLLKDDGQKVKYTHDQVSPRGLQPGQWWWD